MPFGERIPGPEAFRKWMDRQMGFVSQEAGELKPGCAFVVPTPEGDVRVHPLICSEALMPERTRRGLALSQADLLANASDVEHDTLTASNLQIASQQYFIL